MLDYEELTVMVVATAALGNAVSAIVQALKWGCLRTAGFQRIRSTLGDKMMDAVESVLGPDTDELLRAQYRHGRSKGPLGKTLRQGTRIGLTKTNAQDLAGVVGSAVSGKDLQGIATSLAKSDSDLTAAQRGLLARYELAVDERIDAALALAEETYIQWVRFWAIVVAITLALLASSVLACDDWFLRGLIVGVAAVPLAPISHDLQKALTEAGKAVRPREK